MDQGELPRVVKLEARDALPAGGDRWLRKFSRLAAVDEGLEGVLLDTQIIVGDCRQSAAQVGEVGDGFLDAVVGNVIGRWLRP